MGDAAAADLAGALALIPPAERGAFIEHIKRLAWLSPGKRAAVYTLTE